MRIDFDLWVRCQCRGIDGPNYWKVYKYRRRFDGITKRAPSTKEACSLCLQMPSPYDVQAYVNGASDGYSWQAWVAKHPHLRGGW